MKRFWIVTAFALAAGPFALGQDPHNPQPPPAPKPVVQDGPAPKMALSSTEFNFGDVWSGDKAETEIEISNKGEGPLKFSVRSSCGCTVAQMALATRLTGEEFQYQLDPGKADKIKITYDTHKNRKDVSQTITVQTNDPTQPQASIQVKGHVKPLVEMTGDGRFNFVKLSPGQVSSQTIEIRSNVDQPAKMTLKDAPENVPFEYKLEEVEAGKVYKLTATTKNTIKVGANNAVVTVETGIPQQPTLQITTLAYIAPRVKVTPEVFYVSPKMATPYDRVIHVNYQTNQPIHIKEVKPGLDSIKAEILPPKAAATGGSEEQIDIKVKLPPSDQIPAEGTTIEITTDDADPQYQKFTVKIVQPKGPQPGVKPAVPPQPGQPGGAQPGSPTPAQPGGAQPTQPQPGGAQPANPQPSEPKKP